MLRRLANSQLLPQLTQQLLPASCQQACLLQQPQGWQLPQQQAGAAVQLQQAAAFSKKLNPKEQKRDQKSQQRKDKKDRKADAAVGSSGESGSFAEDGAAVEPDITRLVLQAIHNVTPLLDVRAVRTATKVNYVPGLMPPKKARSLALHWLVKAADARAKGSRGGYAECLALELLLAYQKKGAARQKRDDLHKLALQNRANVHQRWW
uniref:Small ribosomal subunit protein uS7 domain-containing protein n=1 Tax=Tetradesmus obliquus TaxID=3088 RepID=A0A383WFJ6_TETOB|eukprot:jgi/Sobl393_1/1924/SZX76357.1